MTSKLYTFFNQIQGNWSSQKTIYYLRSKKICINQSKNTIAQFIDTKPNNQNKLLDNAICYLKCTNFKTNYISYYYFTEDNPNDSGKIEKIENMSKQIYKYRIEPNNCLKISYINESIYYTEYIYIISTNFSISIAFLKKMNKYIAIFFSSHIKILNKHN